MEHNYYLIALIIMIIAFGLMFWEWWCAIKQRNEARSESLKRLEKIHDVNKENIELTIEGNHLEQLSIQQTNLIAKQKQLIHTYENQ